MKIEERVQKELMNGFSVIYDTKSSITLEKKKKFCWALSITTMVFIAVFIGLIFGFVISFGFYGILYCIEKDHRKVLYKGKRVRC